MKYILTLILFALVPIVSFAQPHAYERTVLYTYEKRMSALQRDTIWLPGSDYDITGDSTSFSAGIYADSVQVQARIMVTDCNGNSANVTWATYEAVAFNSTLNRRAVFGPAFPRLYSWWCGRMRLAVYNGKNYYQNVKIIIYRHKKRGI